MLSCACCDCLVRPCVSCLCPETLPPSALCHFLVLTLTCCQSYPVYFPDWYLLCLVNSPCLVPPLLFKFSLSFVPCWFIVLAWSVLCQLAVCFHVFLLCLAFCIVALPVFGSSVFCLFLPWIFCALTLVNKS